MQLGLMMFVRLLLRCKCGQLIMEISNSRLLQMIAGVILVVVGMVEGGLIIQVLHMAIVRFLIVC